MRPDHLHIRVGNIDETIQWFKKFLGMQPNYHDGTMAMYPLGELAVLFDKSDQPTPATIGFSSENCDDDFRKLVRLGAATIKEPADQPYGVRSAYVKGPGDLTIEIEQILRAKS